MGYPDRLLAPEERLLLHRHRHWKALIAPTLWGAVLTGGAIALYLWIDGRDLEATLALALDIALLVAWAVLVGWLTVAPFVRWITTHFVITDRRVVFRTGVFTRSGIDIPLARVNTVQFRHGLIDRMFRTGTLIIESASDDPLEFDNIPQVERVHAMLYDELHDELTEADRT
ncbi:PH domain-containing protein [Demequina sp. SO4-13]|uniref:PH domain-containing protein n=1 Tax=Demequina sp. SO4-13 TaxID=3401027 RepID=UPI003AF49857